MTKLISLIVLLALSFIGGCSQKTGDDAESVATIYNVYLITVNDSGRLVAHVPGHAINVVVRFDGHTESPFVEVPILYADNWFGPKKKFIAWRFGGTLILKDDEQLKKLWLNRPE